MLIPGGTVVPGGQLIDVVIPGAAEWLKTNAPHVVTVMLPAPSAGAARVPPTTTSAPMTMAAVVTARIHPGRGLISYVLRRLRNCCRRRGVLWSATLVDWEERSRNVRPSAG